MWKKIPTNRKTGFSLINCKIYCVKFLAQINADIEEKEREENEKKNQRFFSVTSKSEFNVKVIFFLNFFHEF